MRKLINKIKDILGICRHQFIRVPTGVYKSANSIVFVHKCIYCGKIKDPISVNYHRRYSTVIKSNGVIERINKSYIKDAEIEALNSMGQINLVN